MQFYIDWMQDWMNWLSNALGGILMGCGSAFIARAVCLDGGATCLATGINPCPIEPMHYASIR